jgi:hypothetical protein
VTFLVHFFFGKTLSLYINVHHRYSLALRMELFPFDGESGDMKILFVKMNNIAVKCS